MKNKFIYIIFILFNVLVSYNADGQQWVHYDTTNTGLSTNWITKVLIDLNGSKWFLNQSNELINFDGVNWQTFNYSNSILPNSNLNSICVDRNDKLIICSDSGLIIKEGTSWSKFTVLNSCLTTNKLFDAEVDLNNFIWISSEVGLIRMDTLFNCTVFTSANGESLIGTREVEIDQSNRIWTLCNTTSSPLNLCFYDGIAWQVFNSLSVSSHFSPSALFCDSSGSVFGSCTYGLFKCDGQNLTVQYDTSLFGSFEYINAIALSSGLVSSYSLTTETLNYFDGSNWNYLNNSNSPLDYELYSLQFDRSNNLWLGGFNGIYEFNPSGIVDDISFNPPLQSCVVYPSLASECINFYFPSSKYSVYRLSVFSTDGKTIITEINSNNNDNINNVSQYRIGQLESGIYFYTLTSSTDIIKGKFVVVH